MFIVVYLFFFFLCVLFFFLQAEDGIRDLVRSRGLGDVYKRQHDYSPFGLDERSAESATSRTRPAVSRQGLGLLGPVSYTHLTLPTSDLV